MSVYEKRGNKYYLKYEDGIRTYLGNEKVDEVQELKLRKILFDISSKIKSNEPLILDFLNKYRDPSPQVSIQSLGPAYQSTKIDLFSFNKNGSEKNWGDQPYSRNEKHPEQLTQKTLKGDLVRSKSEVIIANTYLVKSAQYRYEEMTQVGNKLFAPDFKVFIPRLNKIKIHEHFGQMHEEKYRESAMWKMEYYIANGYRPYEDILFTFDDLDGNIDAQVLDLLITNFMM